MYVSLTDNSVVKKRRNLPISNPKPDLQDINAHTEFSKNPLTLTRRTTDGWTDIRTANAIPQYPATIAWRGLKQDALAYSCTVKSLFYLFFFLFYLFIFFFFFFYFFFFFFVGGEGGGRWGGGWGVVDFYFHICMVFFCLFVCLLLFFFLFFVFFCFLFVFVFVFFFCLFFFHL